MPERRTTRSILRSPLFPVVVAVGFLWLFEATMLDSRYVRRLTPAVAPDDAPAKPPEAGAHLQVSATAYCKGQLTTSGVNVQAGIAAADPALLAIGSIVQLAFDDDEFDGIYSVLDTGPAVKGRKIDVYLPTCDDALRFGRRQARVTILRLGWNPQAITRPFFERLLRPAIPAARPSPAAP